MPPKRPAPEGDEQPEIKRHKQQPTATSFGDTSNIHLLALVSQIREQSKYHVVVALEQYDPPIDLSPAVLLRWTPDSGREHALRIILVENAAVINRLFMVKHGRHRARITKQVDARVLALYPASRQPEIEAALGMALSTGNEEPVSFTTIVYSYDDLNFEILTHLAAVSVQAMTDKANLFAL